MLTSYFDDSGKELDSAFVCLAGFVGDVEQWLRFENDWRDILALPQFGLTYFHMKEVRQATKPPFDRFKDNHALREDLFDRLIRALRVRVKRSFVGLVRLQSYEAVNREYKIHETFGPPHLLASKIATKRLFMWHEATCRDEPLRVVCDQGMDYFGRLSDDMYEEFGQRPIPESVKKSPGLQASDFVAWEARRAMTDRYSGRIRYKEQMRSSVKELAGIGRPGFPPADWFVATESELRVMCEASSVEKREPGA
jgi:hypothetical protein